MDMYIDAQKASGVKQEFQLEFVPYLREDNASEMQDTQQTQHVIETAKTSLETLLSIPLDSFLSVVIYDLECRQFLDSYLQFLERDYDLLIDSAGQGSQYKRFSDLFSDERNEIHRYVLSVFVRPLAQSQQVKQLHVGLSNETHSVPNSQGQYENFLVESGFFSTSRLLDLANCYTALDDEPNDETKYLKWLRGIAKCLFGDNGVRRLIVFRREVTSSLGQTVSECVDKLTTVICTGCALEEGSSSESDEDLLKRAIGANLSNDDILMCSQIVEFLVEVVSTLSNVILSYPPLALSMVFESSDERASSAAAAASDPSVSLKGREFWDSSIISNLCYLYEHCIPLLAFCILDEEQCETALNGENKNLDELYNKSSLTKSLRYVAFQISRFLSGILMHSYLWLLDAKKVIGTDVRTQNTEELNAPSYLEEDAREVDSATISEKIFELVSSAYSSVVGLPDARDEDHSLILQGRKGKCFAEVFQVSSLESALRGLLRSIQKGHGTAFSLDEARKEYFIEEIEELLDSSGPSTAEPPAEMQDSGDAAFRKIKDIFPQIDDARVKEYLKLESNNVSRVIEHISEGTRPQNDSHVQPKSSSSALEEGRNDSDFQTKMKQLIRLQGFDEYEDEYDDSFDAIGAYGVNDYNLADQELQSETMDDEETEPAWIRRRREFLAESATLDGAGEEDTSSLPSEASKTPLKHKTSDKKAKAKATGAGKDAAKGLPKAANSKQSGSGTATDSKRKDNQKTAPPRKKVEGKGPRAAGGYTTRDAKKKTEKKAAVANHNRKQQASKKLSRAM